jgi:hypothetical protein
MNTADAGFRRLHFNNFGTDVIMDFPRIQSSRHEKTCRLMHAAQTESVR